MKTTYKKCFHCFLYIHNLKIENKMKISRSFLIKNENINHFTNKQSLDNSVRGHHKLGRANILLDYSDQCIELSPIRNLSVFNNIIFRTALSNNIFSKNIAMQI